MKNSHARFNCIYFVGALGDDLILSEKDLHILTEILRPAVPQWRTIGGSLGILEPDLSIIESSPLLISEGLPGYLREMLSQWLKWAPPNHSLPTLEALGVALQRSRHEGLAFDLKPLFLQRKGKVGFESYIQPAIVMANMKVENIMHQNASK